MYVYVRIAISLYSVLWYRDFFLYVFLFIVVCQFCVCWYATWRKLLFPDYIERYTYMYYMDVIYLMHYGGCCWCTVANQKWVAFAAYTF